MSEFDPHAKIGDRSWKCRCAQYVEKRERERKQLVEHMQAIINERFHQEQSTTDDTWAS